MISIIFSILSGVTIVLSRSVNGMLSKKMGAYQGTFYNYFTGFMKFDFNACFDDCWCSTYKYFFR